MSQEKNRPEDGADHPGAAFGIPRGATGEEVVDAVFGQAVGAPGAGGAEGINPELLPYLEAAGTDGSTLVGGLSLGEAEQEALEAQAAAEAQEQEDREALRALVAANLIPGGDMDRLEELLAQADADDSDDWESWESQLPEARAPGLSEEEVHRRELQEAARSIEVAERMRQVEAQILARAPEHQVQPSLERVEMVLDILGNPERGYRTVHITGTNGKTSTARMAERLLAATGMRTGRFTSPHLASIRERIALDGEPISPEGFIAAWEDVAPYIEMVDERSQATGGPRLSFFEVLTVMALAAFADHPVDVAIIEVGMGGRWDATNVIPADIAVITPVGRDHERWLGASLSRIAAEKAGVIKEGGWLITAHQVPEVRAEIEAALAAHRAVEWRELDPQEDPAEAGPGTMEVGERQVAVGGQLVTLRTPAAVYQDVFVPLHGEYQAHNALLALAAAEAVFGGSALAPRVVEEGLSSVTSPGRLEVMRSSPSVLVDAAHNPHGVEALVAAVEEVFGFRHLVAVVGAMADKDVEGILAGLEPVTDAVVCVPIDTPRAMDVADLAEIAREVYGAERVVVAETLGEGVEQAVSLSEGFDAPMTASGVLIVGSVILAAQARALFGRA